MDRQPVARISAIFVALLLAGCGFHPLYGRDSVDPHVASTLQGVFVEPVSERIGYDLRNDLIDLLDSSDSIGDSQYRLKLYLNGKAQAVVLQSNTSITRYNYTLTAHYELTPKGSTTPDKMGDVTALAAYDVAAAPFLYATATGERDAQRRASNEIAERIRLELAVYLHDLAEKSVTPKPAAR